MSTTTEETVSRLRTGTDTRTRTGGAWLGVGALLLAVGLVLHPPPSAQGEFASVIAGGPTRWVAAHVVTAFALFVLTVAALLLTTSDSRLTHSWWTTSAWASLMIAALWITTAAVAEATVVTEAAVAGDTATYEAWQLFAEAHSVAFVPLALAFVVIAGDDARRAIGVTPAWASWLGAAAGVLALAGYVLGLGLGIGAAGVVWLVASVVMSLWALWFGLTLARTTDATWAERAETDRGTGESVP